MRRKDSFKTLPPIEWVEREQKYSQPRGAFRQWRDRIGGKTPDSGTIAWVPQCTCPRPPFGKPNLGSGPGIQRIFRPEPMKRLVPHSVPPWAGRTRWASPNAPCPTARLVANGKSTEITHSIGRRPS
jgi:hypothetical protein